MTRKSYTKEFKLDAISLVLEQDYKVAEAARSHSGYTAVYRNVLQRKATSLIPGLHEPQ